MVETSLSRRGVSRFPVLACITALLTLIGFNTVARADDWSAQLDLKPLRTLAVQNDQTIKTLDSLARQSLVTITGHSTIDGHEATFTLLDMAINPDAYVNRNLIKIVSLPLRQDFQDLQTLDYEEQQRILKEQTVSLAFLEKPETEAFLQGLQSRSVIRFNAVQQLLTARAVMQQACEQSSGLIPAAMVPPAPGPGGDGMWHPLMDVAGAVPSVVAWYTSAGKPAPPSSPGYADSKALSAVVEAQGNLMGAWQDRDAARVNQAAVSLAAALEQVNPAVYPPQIKRDAEVLYNKFARLTVPGAAFYFTAFVLFLLAARTASPRLRLWGLRFMTVGFLIHTLSIGVRWWLVGSVFPPIKNEFESVMFSAWFGVVVGFILELRRSQGIFAAAACFVGTLSLMAIFSAPYVTGIEIGGEIAPVQGILMSYWLYIHVTMVTAAYSLIGMGFLLGAWWLVLYYRHYGTLRRVPRNLLSSDAAPEPKITDSEEAFGGAGGGAIALGFTHTLARMFFFPVQASSAAPSRTAAKAMELPSREKEATFLATLDRCNLVMVQLVFLILGVGIMLGAIWADQSWGRPWGWDPKETFALVTWIFYLLVLHVRIVTVDKAWWTSVLACTGFAVMLFNWIGVNFWLVGLHSYA